MRANKGSWGLLLVLAALGGCSTLNEDIRPEIDCAQSPDTRVCADAVLATCSGGQPTYRVCEDDGLVCGETPTGADCVSCAVQCRGRVCGDDGCGGTCGTCPEGASCTLDGQCDPPVGFRVATVEVVDDDNGDGVVSPGESSGLRIALENTGIVTARQVRATISVETVGAGIDAGPVLYFGDMEVGATACGASSATDAGDCSSLLVPRFRVSGDNLAAGQRIGFHLTITTVNGHSLERSFDYELIAIDQEVAVSSTMIVSEPNGDGVLSPGEAATIRLTARNDGTTTAVGLLGVLSAETPGVTVLSPTVYFGDLSAGESGCGSRTQAEAGSCASTVLSTVRLDPSVAGPWVTFRMTFYDAFGTESEAMFTQGIGPIDQVFTLTDTEIVTDTNGDGAVSAGEWALVRLHIKNTGSAKALDVTATLSSNDPRAIVSNGMTLYFGDIDPGATPCGSWRSFQAGSCTTTSVARVDLVAGIPAGTVITLPIDVRDKYGHTTSLSTQIVVAP